MSKHSARLVSDATSFVRADQQPYSTPAPAPPHKRPSQTRVTIVVSAKVAQLELHTSLRFPSVFAKSSSTRMVLAGFGHLDVGAGSALRVARGRLVHVHVCRADGCQLFHGNGVGSLRLTLPVLPNAPHWLRIPPVAHPPRGSTRMRCHL